MFPQAVKQQPLPYSKKKPQSLPSSLADDVQAGDWEKLSWLHYLLQSVWQALRTLEKTPSGHRIILINLVALYFQEVPACKQQQQPKATNNHTFPLEGVWPSYKPRSNEQANLNDFAPRNQFANICG